MWSILSQRRLRVWIHAQMKLIERLRFHLTISALRARRLAGLALALALAGALVPVHVEAAATVDGQFAELGIRDAGVTTSLVVANRGGVPANATAVTLNVTSTGSLGGGFVTVYPCGTPRPNTSNVNFAPGSTVANAVTTKVGAGGAVCIYNDAATHLIVDVNGYYRADGELRCAGAGPTPRHPYLGRSRPLV